MHVVSAQTFFADSPYAGTVSLMRNNPQSARARRGKYKGNKAEPRGMNGTRTPKPRNTSTSTVAAQSSVARGPEVTRYAALAGAQKDVD